MAHGQNFLNFFFSPKLRGLVSLQRSGLIIFILILFNTIATAQETPPEEFVLDASLGYDSLFVDSIYNSFVECGFNTMMQRATNNSKPLLENFNIHAINMKDSTDWIYYYSSAYYSKWEAEENQEDLNKVGVKHTMGDTATWHATLCWSSKNYSLAPSPNKLLMFGPSYHQEKWYRRWLMMPKDSLYNLKYTPRYRMALSNPYSVSDTQVVCKLYVLLKYCKIENNVPDSADSTFILKEPITLKISDFPTDGQFKYFYFSDLLEERWYEYPSNFRDLEETKLTLPNIAGIYRDDKLGGTGVQFCVEWLRNDTLCTIYIDNVEVYDNDGWNRFIADPDGRANDIKTYALNFKNAGWNNIKYWMGGHEPSSIDEYTPIRVVDSLIQEVGAPPLMNVIWPHWTLDLNGEVQLERYYNQVQPDKLFIDFYPISAAYDVVRPFDLEVLRRIFQVCHTLTQDSGFYYHSQSFGFRKNGEYHTWRFPTIPEYKATVMLALAHGADGITQAQYNSDPESEDYDGVEGLIGFGPNYTKTGLWYELKNNIIPRIKGKLGTTLLALNYTGDYLYLGRYLTDLCCGFENSLPTVTERYLTLTEYIPDSYDPPIHFHAGFFSRPGHEVDNYFMLDNLITTEERKVWVTVVPPVSGYKNYRFRNIEGVFDTTFDGYSSGILKLIVHPAGEGFLYQVAPVIKYGGRLLYSEATQPGMILYDDMIIESGAFLTVNGVYSAKGNITVKSGGIINGSNGKIQFVEGKKLIIEGSGSISGTAGSKLELTFSESQNEFISGIMIKPSCSLTISNCKIENATIGIESTLNANYLNAQNVDFINCETHSISIAGRSSGMLPTPPPLQTGEYL